MKKKNILNNLVLKTVHLPLLLTTGALFRRHGLHPRGWQAGSAEHTHVSIYQEMQRCHSYLFVTMLLNYKQINKYSK